MGSVTANFPILFCQDFPSNDYQRSTDKKKRQFRLIRPLFRWLWMRDQRGTALRAELWSNYRIPRNMNFFLRSRLRGTHKFNCMWVNIFQVESVAVLVNVAGYSVVRPISQHKSWFSMRRKSQWQSKQVNKTERLTNHWRNDHSLENAVRPKWTPLVTCGHCFKIIYSEPSLPALNLPANTTVSSQNIPIVTYPHTRVWISKRFLNTQCQPKFSLCTNFTSNPRESNAPTAR